MNKDETVVMVSFLFECFFVYIFGFVYIIKLKEEKIMQNYETVPAIISCKDLDYLSDIYNWNFNACKLANHFSKEVEDQEIKELLEEIASMHEEHTKAVLNILR